MEKQTYANVSANCQSYYECLTTPSGKQITVSRTCPSPLIYSEDKRKCVKEKDLTDVSIKCSTNRKHSTHPSPLLISLRFRLPVRLSAPTSPSANCWDPSAVITDTQCRFFTDCSSKRRFECPPESSFERNLKRCVPKEHVQCWW